MINRATIAANLKRSRGRKDEEDNEPEGDEGEIAGGEQRDG